MSEINEDVIGTKPNDDQTDGSGEPVNISDLLSEGGKTVVIPERAFAGAVGEKPTPKDDNESEPVVEETDEAVSASEETPHSEEKETQNDAPADETPKALSNDAVTGHTASLWKYNPIPANEPEPAPEYISLATDLAGGRVIAARVRGKKHKHDGTNCDDWFEVAGYENMTFIAVSDGAGSKKFSRIGSRESCKASVGYLVNSFKELFTDRPELKDDLSLSLSDPKCQEACGVLAGAVQGSVLKAREAVEAAFYSRAADPVYEKVLGRGLQLKDLSATLLIAVLIPISESTKEHLVITCQIGDGMIAILNTKGEFANSVKLMGVPDSGEFSGETDFLTSEQMKNIESLQRRTKISRTALDVVMVMSDGVADDYFPNETEMRRLYFDLVVNGVLENPSNGVSVKELKPDTMKAFKRLPDPLSYPWVNDQSVKVPLHYTNRICSATDLTLEDLWKDPTPLGLARLELEEGIIELNQGERLKRWLDNYVERGSFDDRTLVIATV